MADRYTNIPSVQTTIDDGNLRPAQAETKPAVVVIGYSSRGPAGTPVMVTSPSQAIHRFGSVGSLARGIAEAFAGGASTVLALRTLATPAVLDGVGKSADGTGFKITTIERGSTAGDGYSVLALADTKVLAVYSLATGRRVYEQVGDVVTEDLGIVLVEGSFDADLVAAHGIASVGKPLPVCPVETDQTCTVAANALNVARTTVTIAGAGLNLSRLKFNSDVVVQLSSATTKWETRVSAVDAAAGTITLTDILPESVPERVFSVRFISRLVPAALSEIVTNRLSPLSTKVTIYTRGSDANGLPLKDGTVDGLGWDDSVEEAAPGKMNMYEAIDDMVDLLSTYSFNTIYVPDVYLDDEALGYGVTPSASILPAGATVGKAGVARLVVTSAGSTAAFRTSLDAAGNGGSWVVIKARRAADGFGGESEVDEVVRVARVLSYEAKDADETYVYLDRDLPLAEAGTLADTLVKFYPGDQLFYHRAKSIDGVLRHMWYDESMDIDGYAQHEVNFAHKLGQICLELSDSYRTTTGVIGVKAPQSLTNPASLARWVGRAPTYDYDGNIVVNGTGLLGNKFLAGQKQGSAQFAAGFWATESGYLDDDSLLRDNNNNVIDLGKFISIASTWVRTSNLTDSTKVGYYTSFAGMYAGLISALAPWVSATGSRISGSVQIPMPTLRRHLDALIGARMVVLESRSTGLTILAAPTASRPTSDFTQNMSMRLTAEAANRVRSEVEKFIGKPLTFERKKALETLIEGALSNLRKDAQGALENSEFIVVQTEADKAAGTVTVGIGLEIVDELRKAYVAIGRRG